MQGHLAATVHRGHYELRRVTRLSEKKRNRNKSGQNALMYRPLLSVVPSALESLLTKNIDRSLRSLSTIISSTVVEDVRQAATPFSYLITPMEVGRSGEPKRLRRPHPHVWKRMERLTDCSHPWCYITTIRGIDNVAYQLMRCPVQAVGKHRFVSSSAAAIVKACK